MAKHKEPGALKARLARLGWLVAEAVICSLVGLLIAVLWLRGQ
jgi:hypothetical protein